MYDSDNINDFRLTPDLNDKFEGKAMLKRSELLDNQGNLLDETLIAVAEGDCNDTEIVNNIYADLKLKANTAELMPDKNSLKRKANSKLAIKQVIAIVLPLAATLMLAWFVLKPNTDITIHPSDKIAQNDSTQNKQPQIIPDVKTEKEPSIKTDSSKNKKTITLKPSKIIKPKDLLAKQTFTTNQREQVLVEKIDLRANELIKINANDFSAHIPEIQYTQEIYYAEDDILEQEYEQNPSLFGIINNLLSSKEKQQKNERKQPWIDHVIQQRLIALNSLLGKESTIVKQYDSTGTLLLTVIDSDGLKYTKTYASNIE